MVQVGDTAIESKTKEQLKTKMLQWAELLEDLVEAPPEDPFSELVKEIRETAKLL